MTWFGTLLRNFWIAQNLIDGFIWYFQIQPKTCLILRIPSFNKIEQNSSLFLSLASSKLKVTISKLCCLPWLWIAKTFRFHWNSIYIMPNVLSFKFENIKEICRLEFEKFKNCEARFVILDHEKISIHQKLFVFRHFLRWVGYCLLNDLEITINSRQLIFLHTKWPNQGFKMTPKRKMCVV